jgi:hypothetical protein
MAANWPSTENSDENACSHWLAGNFAEIFAEKQWLIR